MGQFEELPHRLLLATLNIITVKSFFKQKLPSFFLLISLSSTTTPLIFPSPTNEFIIVTINYLSSQYLPKGLLLPSGLYDSGPNESNILQLSTTPSQRSFIFILYYSLNKNRTPVPAIPVLILDFLPFSVQ